MLEYLDQLAFSALLLLSQIVGTPDIPKNPDPDWQIIQPWTELPDKTYEVKISSSSIGNFCANNLEKVIIFPQTYMGQYEIYYDGRLIHTNSLHEKWKTASMFSEVYLSCSQIANAKELKVVFSSYLKFFAVLPYLPYKAPSLPAFYFFSKHVHMFAASVCLFLGLIGMTIVYKLLSLEKAFSFVIEDLFFLLLMISASGEIVGGFSIRFAHALVLLGLWGGMIFFFSYIRQNKSIYTKYIWMGCLSFLVLIFYVQKNAIQFMIYFPIAIAQIYFIYLNAKQFKQDKYNITERVLLASIFISSIISGFQTIVYRTGITSLAFYVIVVATFKFLRILREFNLHIKQQTEVRAKLNSELTINRELYAQKERYRSILHDVKSPISSLAIIQNIPGDKAIEMLGRIVKQFNVVLARVERESFDIDYYSSEFLTAKIKNLIDDLAVIHPGIQFHYTSSIGSQDKSVVCSDVELIFIINELVTNSMKYSADLTSIKCGVIIDEIISEMVISYSDDGKTEIANSELLGKRGYTTSGSGTGLSTVKNKIEGWGGSLVFFPTRKIGFNCEVRLKLK